MQAKAVRTRIFREGENLISFIIEHVQTPKERSVLAVTSKIVALSEKRTRIIRTESEKEAIIRSESEVAIPTQHAWLTIKDGTVMATAGIDASNADGKIILLPKNSFSAARAIQRAIRNKFNLKRLGVIVTDSRVLPLRAGVTGVAIGYAGFKGLYDYRGAPDIFGRKLRMTQVNIADALATTAVLLMGEGNEQRPLAIIENPPVVFTEKVHPRELRIAIKDDLYYPLFKNISSKK